MKKIMFNDEYGLTKAVLEGRKTQTRRTFLKPGEENLLHGITPEYLISVRSRYKLGETIVIAQSYKDIHAEILREVGDLDLRKEFRKSKGYKNKMFVRAENMPHSIRITNIRVEHLQDISDEDCMKEGVGQEYNVPEMEGTRLHDMYTFPCANGSVYVFETPREAFAALIDRVSGRGTWDSNPYVFVYSFELIK